MTAAHKTLPFGTRVRISDQKTGRSVTVTINDRGPFGKRRVLDVSPSAARALGMVSRGVILVRAEVL
jgi:rare lipoprotein A